jgi:hypothetical protein
MNTKPVLTPFRLMFRLLCAGIVTSGGLIVSSASEERPPDSRASIALSDPRSPELRLSVAPPLARDATQLPGLALASADFDEDGVPDLVTGFGGLSGSVSIARGNIDAIYPNSPEAKARRAKGESSAAAFLPAAKMFAVPEAVDFVDAGDFDADGHWDIVAAHRNGTRLYWFRGDGHGNFGSAQTIEVGGQITAFTTGDINRADGLSDVVVGIVAQDGARVLIFESPDGALRGPPENFLLAAPASDLAIGQLDDTGRRSLAIASGHEVVVIQGRDRKLSFNPETEATPPPAGVSRRTFQSPVLSIAVGDFSGDARAELALLTAEGSMLVLEREGQSDGNIAAFRIAATMQTRPGQRRVLATKTSTSPKDDVLVFGGSKELQIVTTAKSNRSVSAGTATVSVAASIIGAGEITAVLPMRLNADALSDLVVLDASNSSPSILTTTSGLTYVVNIEGVTNDKTPGDGTCADTNGNCSFNAALQEADAHPGADTITFNIPGGGVHTLTHGFGQYSNEAVTIDGTTQPDGRIEIVANGDYPIIFYGGNSVLRGVAVYGSSTAIALPTSGNIIEGNYIGFRADGTKPAGYGSNGSGIAFQGGVNGSLHGGNNLIGGTTTQARNVISNCVAAVDLYGGLGGNVVQGNYIGTNVAGTAALPNNSVIRTAPAYDATIGGVTAGAGNLISGNGAQAAIDITGAAIVQGNLIGTTANGAQSLANGSYGILEETDGTKTVTIGGTTVAARNVIAASAEGIHVNSTAQIQGNFIGTSADGSNPLPNLGAGVDLNGGNSVIGGTASGAGNLISGNGGNGVRVGGYYAYQGNNNVVQGNLIGTDVTGTLALPNSGNGVEIDYGTGGHLIGGSSVGARNVISGNRQNGIYFTSGNETTRDRAEGNYIGLNRFGSGGIPNGENGVLLDGSGNVVGGTSPGAGNVIAFNAGAGIASISSRIAGIILANSIFSNTGLGIDRGANGVTPFASDYDEYPVLSSVVSSSSSTTITGKLRTYTDGQTSVTIQFFSNTALDPSGYGEGETFVGQATVTQPGYATEVSFTATITPAVPAGRFVTAMATGPTGTNYPAAIGSSEFSAGLSVTSHGQLQFSSANYSVNEGGSSATISVRRTGGSDGSVSVNYATAAGTATGGTSCGSGVDFINASGTLTFASGVTEQSFTVPVCQDSLVEQNETVSLTLSSPSGGATISQGTATLTIIDDDAPNPTPSPTPTPTATPTGTPTGTPLQIFVIAPNRAGDAAPATPQITGQGFQAGATARLTRTGQADIVATNVSISNNGTTLNSTFDLKGKARGVWSVVVTNPGGASAILPDAFTIGEPRAEDVWVDIIGRFSLRTGYDQQFYIAFGNRGDIEAPATKIVVKLPSDLFEITQRPEFPAGEPAFISNDGTTYTIEFYARRIPAGTAQYVPFRLRPLATHVGYEFAVDALTSSELTPLIDRPIDPKTSISLEPVEKSATSEKEVLHIQTSEGHDDVQLNYSITPAPGPRPPSMSYTVEGGVLRMRYEVTLPLASARMKSSVRSGTNPSNTDSPTGDGTFATYVNEKTTSAYGDVVGRDGTFATNSKSLAEKYSRDPKAENAQATGDVRKTADYWLRDNVGFDQDPKKDNEAFQSLNSKTQPGIWDSIRDTFSHRDLADYENSKWADELYEKYTKDPGFRIRFARRTNQATDRLLPRRSFFTELEKVEFNARHKGRAIPGSTAQSGDPNAKTGPQGAGAAQFITGAEPMSYLIQFENKPEASAAAQEIVITDQLDSTRFNFASFQLGPISFGDRIVAPLPGLSQWTTDVDLRPENNLLVRINAKLDKTSGLLTWRFQSVDPATGQPTTDPSAGFLPPNKTSPQGQGSVLFSIDPAPGLVTGAEIRNKARIVFDKNPPIDTPEWLNTIDNSAPVSQVIALPAAQPSSRFRVQWTGSDTGSGVHSYTVYVSENGGPFTVWLQETTATSAAYDGRPNARYSFYSIADDNAQNRELPPPSADASTTTLDGQLPNVSTRSRVGTGDNVLIGGFIITGGESKKVLIRGIGPSLSGKVSDVLPDPVLELFQGATSLARNDNWKDDQPSEIEATTIPPTNNYEAAIVRTLDPGSYTVILSGNGSTGIGVVEVYDLSRGSKSTLANLSSRGFVGTNDNVMIGGFIVGGSAGASTKVLIRAIGPSLGLVGVKGALTNPFLELHDANGNLIDQNDNWQERRAEIEATTIPPSDPLESAIVRTLVPGNYSAIVRGVEKATGIALVEIYDVN